MQKIYEVIFYILLPLLISIQVCHSSLHINTDKSLYDILDIKSDAELIDVKKSYKQLALEYHPDKISQNNPNINDKEKNELNDMFLDIQYAYEILHNKEKRLQYDLKLQGIQYDIDETDIDINENIKYMLRPFHFYMKSTKSKMKFKLHFYSNFVKPKIPDIVISLEVGLDQTLTGEILLFL